MFTRKKEGFTLIELLIVIAILSMLVAVVLVLINPVALLDRSRATAAKNYAAKLCNAVQACAVRSTDGLCPKASLPSVSLPSGVSDASVNTTTVTATAPSSAAANECVFTCTVATGVITADNCVVN